MKDCIKMKKERTLITKTESGTKKRSNNLPNKYSKVVSLVVMVNA